MRSYPHVLVFCDDCTYRTLLTHSKPSHPSTSSNAAVRSIPRSTPLTSAPGALSTKPKASAASSLAGPPPLLAIASKARGNMGSMKCSNTLTATKCSRMPIRQSSISQHQRPLNSLRTSRCALLRRSKSGCRQLFPRLPALCGRDGAR